MSKYVIEQNLISTAFEKVDKSTQGYEKRIVELTDEELQQKIKQSKELGLKVEFYHQESFDDGMRFIKDGEGLDDIKKMTKLQLNEQLEYCRREVTNICKKEILNGNIEQLRTGDYHFATAKRVRNIIFQYIRQNHRKTINYKDIKDILYFFSCILNIDDTLDVIYDIVDENICFLGNFLGDLYEIDIERQYLGVLLNEIYLEDLLIKMLRKNELTEEEYQKYSWFPYEFGTIEEEKPNYENIYSIVYSCNVNN